MRVFNKIDDYCIIDGNWIGIVDNCDVNFELRIKIFMMIICYNKLFEFMVNIKEIWDRRDGWVFECFYCFYSRFEFSFYYLYLLYYYFMKI